MSEKYSTCPVVRDEVIRLWDEVTVGGVRRLVPFEQRVVWLRSSETVIELRHRQAVVAKLTTFSDWYGFLTSLEAAIDECRRLARNYDLQPNDALHITQTTTIRDVPHLPVIDSRKKYLPVDRDQRFATSDQPAGQYVGGSGPYYPWLRDSVSVVASHESRMTSEQIPGDLRAWIDAQRSDADCLRLSKSRN